MRTASEEIRQLVVNACESGAASREQLVEIFGYSLRTMARWVAESRGSGRTAPLPKGHRPPAFSQEERREIAAFIEGAPGATLAEIGERFGKTCSLAAVCRAVLKLGHVF